MEIPQEVKSRVTIWTSDSTPGNVSCREPAWGTPPMAKVMRKEAWHTQRRDRASGNPLFPSIYPQNQSLPTLLFHALTYTSDFTGGWPPLPLSEKALTYSSKSIKIPRHDKSVSTYELLWRLSSLPVQFCLATCDCLQPPNHERHEMFWTYWRQILLGSRKLLV